MKSRHKIIEFQDISSHLDLPAIYIDQIADCVHNAFGGNVTKEDALNHMQGSQVLLALEELSNGEKSVVGFSATDIKEDENNHLDATGKHAYFAAAAISQSYQGNGLYGELNDRRLDFIREKGIDKIVTRTQNPRVEEGISRALERLMAMDQIRLFTVARQVIQGVYGGMLTRDKPIAKTVSYDNIDYERGDANLITWRLLS